ncbi:hypothetical protein GGI12_003726 [Dipsacomyces acuminosporus]|nr:hypothetical protein GGI12_003726 [Dipsacomyces acuminosporus]
MEEQYQLWKRQAIQERSLAYGGGIDELPGSTQTLVSDRLTYDDFKNAVMQGNDGGELLNYVNSHVIFQAGVDFESKPMVVFCACNLPNPQMVDYDRLLNLIIFRLDEFVENDYTVVLFTSGAKHNPGWNWLTKAYRRLDRKYRKNVKSVYVVHPSMWSKLIFQIFGKIVSPKFFAKVTWVDTLSHLATLVPLSQINIPQPLAEEEGDREEIAKQMELVRTKYVEEVILPSLTREYRQLLCFVSALLNVVARNEQSNRMTPYSLAIVWAPNMARSSSPQVDVAMCNAGPLSSTVGAVVEIFIQFFEQVFVSELELILGKDRVQGGGDVAMALLDLVDQMNRTANLAHANHLSVGEFLIQKSDIDQLDVNKSLPPLPPRQSKDLQQVEEEFSAVVAARGPPPPIPPRAAPPRVPPRPSDFPTSGADIAETADLIDYRSNGTPITPEVIVAAATAATATTITKRPEGSNDDAAISSPVISQPEQFEQKEDEEEAPIVVLGKKSDQVHLDSPIVTITQESSVEPMLEDEGLSEEVLKDIPKVVVNDISETQLDFTDDEFLPKPQQQLIADITAPAPAPAPATATTQEVEEKLEDVKLTDDDADAEVEVAKRSSEDSNKDEFADAQSISMGNAVEEREEVQNKDDEKTPEVKKQSAGGSGGGGKKRGGNKKRGGGN